MLSELVARVERWKREWISMVAGREGEGGREERRKSEWSVSNTNGTADHVQSHTLLLPYLSPLDTKQVVVLYV